MYTCIILAHLPSTIPWCRKRQRNVQKGMTLWNTNTRREWHSEIQIQEGNDTLKYKYQRGMNYKHQRGMKYKHYLSLAFYSIRALNNGTMSEWNVHASIYLFYLTSQKWRQINSWYQTVKHEHLNVNRRYNHYILRKVWK